MKCSTSRSHLTDEDRFLIEKSWNIPDGRRHPSVRAIAKSLGLAEATLRRELKRGCTDGKYCMVLNDKGKRRWQYFLYSAEVAIQDARWQASAKGPRIKLTTSHISTIKIFLKEWPSIPSAYEAMVNDNQNESFPCLRTFQYHAQKGYWSARVNRRDLYNPHGRRPKHAPPRTAGNHNPTHRIDDLPEEVRKYRVKGYAQMDTIHSGARGKGGLLTMILPKLRDLRQEIVHRALRSIARECRRLGIKITHILTDNGSEFLDEKTIGQIFGATVYRRPDGKVLVAVANFNKDKAPIKTTLTVDWKALGLDPAKTQWHAPASEGFQKEATFATNEAIPLEPARGWLLIAEPKP